MGSYSGFLLLEDLLDTLPEDSTTIYNESNQLFNPSIQVVEDDCGTLLGRKVQIDYSSIGMTDLATGEMLTTESIDFFLSQGKYYRAVRHTAFCTSTGGVCRKCYEATYLSVGSVSVGSAQTATSEIVLGTHIVVVPNGDEEVRLSVSGESVFRADVFVNNEYTQGYTEQFLDDGSLTIRFTTPRAPGSTVFSRMYKATSSPFMSYLSHTYSGNLLGAAPMGVGVLPVREGLIKERISSGRLSSLEVELQKYAENVPATYLAYLANIKDPLEKELFILALYGVFYDVGV